MALRGNEEAVGFLAGCLIWVIVVAASAAGYITHIITCLKAATTEAYILLVVGCVGFPIGVIHGWGVWFGWWG